MLVMSRENVSPGPYGPGRKGKMKTVSSMSSIARRMAEKVEELIQAHGSLALVPLVLDAVESGEMGDGKIASRGEGRSWEVNPKTMLTVLTYCYGVGLYNPEDIEDAIEEHPAISYIAARSAMPASAIRRFRREHRALISQTLARFFESIWTVSELQASPMSISICESLRLELDETASAGLRVECARLAEDHILLALLWDGPAMRD